MKQIYKTYRELFPHLVRMLRTLSPSLSDGQSEPFGRPVRLLLTFFLLTTSISGAWGQDYSGTYYIASVNPILSPKYNEATPSTNFYLCATENWYYYQSSSPFYTNTADANNVMPFMTTYKCRDGVNDSKAVWNIIKKEGTNYYYIKHDGKFLTYNVAMGNSSNAGRMRMHLEKSPTDDDSALFQISYVTKPMDNSSPCFDIITIKEKSRKYVNVSGDNQNSLQGTNAKQDGPNNMDVGGIIGLWTGGSSGDKNSQWWLEIPSPTFSLNGDNKVEIIALGDADIYYTTDGTNPVVPAEDALPSEPTMKYTGAIDLVNGQIMVKAIATNKDHHVISSSIATYVYNPDITWSETSFVYNGSPQTPTVTSVKVGDIVVDATKYSISCNNHTNAGTATLTLSDNDDNDNYHIVEKSVNFTIEKASISPTVSVAAKTYDGNVVTPSVSGNSGNGTVTYAYKVIGADDATYSETAPINAGEYTVKASIAETTNYLSGEATNDFTIAKATLTITAKGHSITYGDEPANDGVDYSGFVNEEDKSVLEGTLAYAYNYSQFGDVGDYTITPSGLTGANYDISFVAGTLTVDQKEVGLIWSETTTFTYDGNSHGLTATATGMVNDDEIDVTVSGAQANAGNHTATASALTGTKAGNYKLPTENTHAFTITPAELTITANDHTITYGAAPAGNGVTYSGFIGTEDENVLSGTLGYDFSYTQYGDVGDYTITPKGLTSTNYDIAFVAGTLTVNPKALTITAEAKSKYYGDADPELTYTSVGLVGSDAFTGELSREAGETVGTYAIYQNTLTAGSNYTTTYTGANLTINKKALTITANPKTIIYGNPPTNDGVTYSGFAGEEDKSVLSGTLTYAYNYTKYGDVGSYTITPSGLTGTNYNISFVAGTLTVAQREVGLIWSETTTFTYDGDSHGLTATATELVNSDEIGITVTGAQTNAGDHTATASSLTGTKAGNYKLPTENTHAFTITPVGLTVTAKDHSITYGAAPAGNGVTYEGFVGEDDENKLGGTLGYDFSYTQFDDVGNTYTITPKGLTSTNYDISFVAGTLTVSQKEVGLSWGGTAFPYDGSPHAPTVTATGLVNGDEIGVTVSGVETNAGNHTATASALTGDKAGNYKLPATKTQSFTISRKSIGDGTLASGYILDFGEGNTILLTDDNIGKTMVISTDYSVSDDTDPSDKYSLRTVTGEGNYTGSFVIRNVIISFTTDTEEEEWSATFVAENGSEFDIGDGLVLPEGVSAFIISGIQGEWAIPEPLDYIPAGVPVLLFAHKPTYGFVPTIAEIETEAEIKDAQKARNMLEVVTAESVHFNTKEIYVLFKNEFVFNKDGDMPKGKVYLNPNHTAPSSSPSPDPAPARLKIAWNYTTGLEDGKWKMEEGRNEQWYTIDGRRLGGKPSAKGLYIVDGKKVVIK